MTTLATIPALFAVALSISTTNDYHYVTIPTNMAASLTGVGMGSEASAEDAPLRYEDAAFLTEAYAERATFFGSYSGASNNPTREVSAEIGLSLLRNVYDEAFQVGETYRPLAYGYAKSDAKLLEDVARAVNFEAVEETGDLLAYDRDVWKDIFLGGTDPFLVAAIDASTVSWNSALTRDKICSFYADLNRLTRPSLRCYMFALGGQWSGMSITDRDASKDIKYYSTIDNSFVYGEHTTETNEWTDSGTFTMSFSTDIAASRQNWQGWDYDSGKWFSVTDVKKSQFASTQVTSSMGNIYATCNFREIDAIAQKLGNRKIKAAYIFGLGYYTLWLNGTETAGRWFVIRIPVLAFDKDSPDKIMVALGTALRHRQISNSVKELFSDIDPGYETGEELLKTVPDPGPIRTPEEGFESVSRTSAPISYSLSRRIDISNWYVVFDVEFNARLPSDGE